MGKYLTGLESDFELMEYISVRCELPDEANEALKIFLTRYEDSLYTQAKLICKDVDSANDLLQDTIIRVVEKSGTFKSKDSYIEGDKNKSTLKWVFVIMKRIYFDSLDEVRKEDDKESEHILKDVKSSPFQIDNADSVDDEDRGESQIETAIPNRESPSPNLRSLEQFILSMPSREQDILRHYASLFTPNKHMPSAEINELARRHGTTGENVKKIWQRCKKKIQLELTPIIKLRP